MRRRLPAWMWLLLASCASDPYRRAADADTIEGYRAFLEAHPKDENAEAAHARLAELEFDRVAQFHTVVAYKRFLEEFSDSPKARDVKALLEALRFNAARERGTVEAWEQFLRDHPDGAHHEEAEKSLEAAQLAAAARLDEPKALQGALRSLPPSERKEAAETRLDDVAFSDAVAKGATALLVYLRTHPAGAHRVDAQAQLLSLQIDGLLASDRVEDARAEAERSPLGKQVPDLDARLAAAEADRAITRSTDPAIQATQAPNYLRSIEDLEKSLHSSDSLDRWEAAQELGQWFSVRAIDPLLQAVRASRNPLVRWRALESLGQVLRALPRPVAEYETATRIEQLEQRAGAADGFLQLAVLRDLSGHLEDASADYQKAFDPGAPDPVILRRWIQIRSERKQFFSSAVAARQLAVWARTGVEEVDKESLASSARELCAAADFARVASEAIQAARAQKTEFPEDLLTFESAAHDTRKLADARLRDAEVALETRTPGSRMCADRRVEDRMNDGLRARLEALRAVRKRAPALAKRLLALAQTRDPAPEARALAAALLGEMRAGR